jgi:phage shock protein E
MKTLSTPRRGLTALFALSTILTIAGCGVASEIQSIPPDSVVVDVRTPREFSRWHFPGAVNIPVGNLYQRFSELDKNKTVVVYCRSGSRSSTAKKLLMTNGFADVKNGGGLRDMKRIAETSK